jgi:hypothetical protein
MERCHVQQVNLPKLKIPAGNLLDTLEGFNVGVLQIVQHDNVVPFFEQ